MPRCSSVSGDRWRRAGRNRASLLPADAPCLTGATHNTLNVNESSVIVRVRGPLVRWNRCQRANRFRAGRAIADGCTGKLAFRRVLSVFTILSCRSIRRHNVTSARAYIAVHIDDAASLLP